MDMSDIRCAAGSEAQCKECGKRALMGTSDFCGVICYNAWSRRRAKEGREAGSRKVAAPPEDVEGVEDVEDVEVGIGTTLDRRHQKVLKRIPETIYDALAGERGSDQKRLAEECLKWADLLLRKNHDYGSSVWKKPVLCPHMRPSTAIFVRMSDKIERIHNLTEECKTSFPEVAESLDDTIRDLGAYCLLYLARPKSTKPTNTNTNT